MKGVQFKHLKRTGDPPVLARMYEEQGADEIVFLDIGASPEHRKIMVDVVKRTAENLFIPLTVGGGIRGLEDIEELLSAGADKVSINTAAIKNPELVRLASDRFGSQCIVIAIDAKKVAPGKWQPFTYGGRVPTGLDALEWAKKAVELGGGEILLTSMDCDGVRGGYDLELTKAIAEAVSVPIIASGGAGSAQHMYEAFEFGKADAALAASVFHFGLLTVREIKEFLRQRGVPVRI